MQEILAELHLNGPKTAREIANSLDVDRRTVNSFLYRIGDVLEKEGNRWSCPLPLTCVELNSGWLTARDIERELKRPAFAAEHLLILVPKGCAMMLDGAAILFSFVNRAVDTGRQVVLHFHPSVFGYWNRMGAFGVLHSDVCVQPADAPDVSHLKGNNSNLVEFESICLGEEQKSLPLQFGEAFEGLSNNSAHSGKIQTVVSELYANVLIHSQTKLPGFIAMQCYRPRLQPKRIQTVVSDFGGGIINTLFREAANDADVAAIDLSNADSKAAFQVRMLKEAGFSSRENGGTGLSSIRQKVKDCGNGDLSIRQDDFCVVLQYREGKLNTKKIDGLAQIQGTHVCFDYYLK